MEIKVFNKLNSIYVFLRILNKPDNLYLLFHLDIDDRYKSSTCKGNWNLRDKEGLGFWKGGVVSIGEGVKEIEMVEMSVRICGIKKLWLKFYK